MKKTWKAVMGLCLGMSIANPAGGAAEMVYGVVSQAPNESGRIRVAYQSPQGEPSQEMDIALIPESGSKKTPADFQVGDKVVIGFKENEGTGMYETSLTKVADAPASRKEMK